MKNVLFTVFAMALLATAQGCASNPPGKQALACRDCKVVAVTLQPNSWGDYSTYPGGDDDAAYRSGYSAHPAEDYNPYVDHRCPKCQGALKTLFKQGKFQHKCSLCESNAFTCPASHRS